MPEQTASVEPGSSRWLEAVREARRDASPSAVAAAVVLVALAFLSLHAHWRLLGHELWWIWLVVAVPYGCLSVVLLFGLTRVIRHDRRREVVIRVLWLVGIFNVGGVALLVVSLLAALGRGDHWTPAAGERRARCCSAT